MTEQVSRRVFFALWPDGPALRVLDALAAQATAQVRGRRMRRDSLHLTLVFIGAATEPQLELLRQAASRVRTAPFEMVLDCTGWWRHNRIFWAGCRDTPPELQQLHAALSGELVHAGFSVEERAFAPHLTLVRNIRCEASPPLELPLRWHVGEFSLVESLLTPKGAHYRVLDRWPLLAG